MAVNIIGLGLLVAGIIFLIAGGVGALFMTWQRRRRPTA